MPRQQELEMKIRQQSSSPSESLALALMSAIGAGEQPAAGEFLGWIHTGSQPATLHQKHHHAQGKEGKSHLILVDKRHTG